MADVGALEVTVTWQQVRDRAGLRQGTAYPSPAAVEAEARRLLAVAVAELEDALVGAFRPMPVPVADDCVLILAKAYADRGRTPGNAQTTSVEDAQLRNVNRDVRAGIRSTLARYVIGLA